MHSRAQKTKLHLSSAADTQLVTRPHQQNSPWGTHNVMKLSPHTRCSQGARGFIPTSWLLIICPQHWAVSSAPSDGGASVACVPQYMHMPKKEKEKKNLSTSSVVGSSAVWRVSKHWGERWEANTVCLWFRDKTERSHRRPYHNNLKWFSHNSLAADCSNLLRLQRAGLCRMLWLPGCHIRITLLQLAQSAGMIWSDSAKRL